MKKFFILALFISVGIAQSVAAQTPLGIEVSKFTKFYDVPPVNVVVPTVAQLQFKAGEVERAGFLVFEEETSKIIPHDFTEGYRQFPASITATMLSGQGAGLLVDDSQTTSMDFLLPENGMGEAVIVLETSKPIYASEIQFSFAENVTLPSTVAVAVRDEAGNAWIAVAPKRMDASTVTFPQVYANRFEVTLTYGQLLRITNIELIENSIAKVDADTLRFIAQPEYSYKVYFNPDVQVSSSVLQGAQLQTEDEPYVLSEAVVVDNPFYLPADSDSDGVRDIADNCKAVANADQTDADKNGEGDACEDFDKDGVMNNRDNCPAYANRSQADEDGDKVGDECDDSESRLTERYAFIPWAGMGIAFIVLCVLFLLVGIKPKESEIKQGK